MGLLVGNSGKATSVPVGLAWGAVISLLVTFLASGVVAWLILTQRLQKEQLGYGVMILLMGASWSGARVSFRKIRRQRLAVCLCSGAVYFGLLLMITALFFGGQYSAVGESALLILCGSMLAVLLKKADKPAAKRRKGRKGYR